MARNERVPISPARVLNEEAPFGRFPGGAAPALELRGRPLPVVRGIDAQPGTRNEAPHG